MADDLPEPKRICEQDPAFPLFIFPGIEDECRRTSLQTTIRSRQGRSSECVSWVTVPTLLPTAKFWDGLLPKVNLIMCWLKFLSMTVERRFSFEELSSQTQLSFHMDEQSPATNHKTSRRS